MFEIFKEVSLAVEKDERATVERKRDSRRIVSNGRCSACLAVSHDVPGVLHACRLAETDAQRHGSPNPPAVRDKKEYGSLRTREEGYLHPYQLLRD